MAASFQHRSPPLPVSTSDPPGVYGTAPPQRMSSPQVEPLAKRHKTSEEQKDITMSDAANNALTTEEHQHLTHSIVGLGNPLLDICADVHHEFLRKYELTLDNAILADDEKHKTLYEEIQTEFKPVFVAGGATQNSIRVAQWMLNKHNSKATSFFGAVGKDEHGKKLRECAEKDGVNVHYMEHDDVATGTCAVCVVESERSLVANLSAANKFHHDHLEDDRSKEIINKGKFFYSSGFHLTVSPEAMMKLANHAHENNKIFLLNLSAPFIVQFFKDPLMAAMPYADFVFGNENEAKEFGKAHNWGEDLGVIALKLAQLPKNSGSRCRTVVFTQGAEPTIVVHQGELQTFPVPALAASEIVDTNGAGDAFVGGFVSRLAMGKPLAACVNAGHWAAQVVIRRSGCTFPEHVQECPTLKPGESPEVRATKFSKMASQILAPASFNHLGVHAFAPITALATQAVQPSDYHVPDKRGVSAGEQLPAHRRFITTSTYQHDFTLFEAETKVVLATSVDTYERAFLTTSDAGDGQNAITLQQVPLVLRQALGDAAVPKIVQLFTSFFDHHVGEERDHLTWRMFCTAIEHVHTVLATPPPPHVRAGQSGLTKVQQTKVIPATTPNSSHLIDFGHYGDIPGHRPYERKRGMASTTSDLYPGTTKDTHHVPGYTGFLPHTTHNPDAVRQADGERPRAARGDLRLFHSDNIPGYTGHKPIDCINYRGENRSGSDPKTTNGYIYHPHS
ncbi:TPA: hypothetical protein N0F65_012663 [Lagenidium giganteum]|uniref:adenosine kinase n=1 Tax=Lagenidium giganteum TaxID=4803 RepID=A0AAV2YKT9_9STRA|nr:TPA: hypothetical protein N0F65_012663 [Lagenidium giganteum]